MCEWKPIGKIGRTQGVKTKTGYRLVDLWAHTFDPKTGSKTYRRFTKCYRHSYNERSGNKKPTTRTVWTSRDSSYPEVDAWNVTHFMDPPEGPKE